MGSNNAKMRDVRDCPDKLSAEKTVTSDVFDSNSSHKGEVVNQKTTFTLNELDLIYTDFIGEQKGKITDEYSLLSPPIGKGSFGEVRRAIHRKTNITRAVKIIYKENTNSEERLTFANEINILKKLDHPNIMKIYEFYHDEKYLYLVTEYFNGGELFDRITRQKSFGEKQAAHTMKQILSAVSYCHSNKIVHRDIKPENILYESNNADAPIKIIDFGTSRFYDPAVHMHQRSGTPYYISPEVLKKDYTEKCDVWSCGVILYVLLCGFPPFNDESEEKILMQVATGKYSFSSPEWDLVSDYAKDLIKRMLEFDPQQRCSAEEALKDPWFKLVLGEPSIDRPLAISALTNLKKFKTESKLQKAVWMVLVSYLASNEEKAQLLKTFQALDLNGDGQLSREELLKGYETIMDSQHPDADVDEILKCVDNNHSGKIDYTEFVIATVNRRKMLNKQKLETIFKLIDKDGDGYLSPDELEQAFNPGKVRLVDKHVWMELLNEFDSNGDGRLSLGEFRDMMNKMDE